MSTIFGVVLVFAMVAVSTGFGDLGGVSFAERYASGLIAIWPVVAVCLTFPRFSQALCFLVSTKGRGFRVA